MPDHQFKGLILSCPTCHVTLTFALDETIAFKLFGICTNCKKVHIIVNTIPNGDAMEYPDISFKAYKEVPYGN